MEAKEVDEKIQKDIINDVKLFLSKHNYNPNPRAINGLKGKVISKHGRGFNKLVEQLVKEEQSKKESPLEKKPTISQKTQAPSEVQSKLIKPIIDPPLPKELIDFQTSIPKEIPEDEESEGYIWPQKENTWSNLFREENISIIPKKILQPREFYLPGNKPKEIGELEWNKILEKNPNQNNNLFGFAVTKLGEIVCMEKPTIAFSMGIVGLKQYGKTTTAWTLANWLYWVWHYKMCMANEALNHCYGHRFPNKIPVFMDKFKMFNLKGHPLPLVFCTPSGKNIVLEEKVERELEYSVSIPFMEFLKRPSLFADFGKSEKHLVRLSQELLNCRTLEEVEMIIEQDNHMPQNAKDSVITTIEKIAPMFDLNENGESHFTLSSNENKFPETKLSPILALMKADLIPCLVTNQLKRKEHETQIFSYYLQKIWDAKDIKKGLLKDEPTVIVCDELNEIQEKNVDILVRIVREGGNLNLNLIWMAQNYGKINEFIRTNTDIVIIFKQAPNDAREIANEYGLDNVWKKKIQNMKKFEAVIISKKYRFKLYNPLSGEWYYVENEPILCEILPPLSAHRAELTRKTNTKTRPKIQEEVLSRNKLTIKNKDGKGILNHPGEIKQYIPNSLKIKEDWDLRVDYFGDKLDEEEEVTYQDLLRMRIRIVSKNISQFIRGSQVPQIRVLYDLWPTAEVVPKGMRLLQSMPDGVKIYLNNLKRCVKLEGNHTAIITKNGIEFGSSEWFSIDRMEKV